MKKQLFFSSSLTLTFGCLIYVLFRSDSLKRHVWFDKLYCLGILKDIRAVAMEFVDVVPNWMLYSLPDGLWLSSCISLILIIWKNKMTKGSLFLIFSMPVIAFLSEAGQFFKIIPGTFDWMDLAMYLLGTLFPLMIYRKMKGVLKDERKE